MLGSPAAGGAGNDGGGASALPKANIAASRALISTVLSHPAPTGQTMPYGRLATPTIDDSRLPPDEIG